MLAAMNRENHSESSSSNQSRDANVPRVQEEYITQVSEKKLFQEFRRAEIRILGPSELTSSGALRIRSGDLPNF